jgi:hypothetical protein
VELTPVKVSARMTTLAQTCDSSTFHFVPMHQIFITALGHSTKVVRTIDKISFFFGVMSLLGTALMFGIVPQYVMTFLVSHTTYLTTTVRWIHVAYTVQVLVLLPVRLYRYKQKQWHYFLFDVSLGLQPPCSNLKRRL